MNSCVNFTQLVHLNVRLDRGELSRELGRRLHVDRSPAIPVSPLAHRFGGGMRAVQRGDTNNAPTRSRTSGPASANTMKLTDWRSVILCSVADRDCLGSRVGAHT